MDKHYCWFKLCKKNLFNLILILFFQTCAYLITCRGEAIQEIMKFIEKAFNNLMESENNDIQQILLNESNYMKKFFRFSNFFFYACVSVCAATPFVENHLICQIYMPGFSEHLYKFNTPLFWLFFIIQNILIYFGI